MKKNGTNKLLKLQFKSCYRNIETAIESALSFLEESAFEHDLFDVNVVLRELLTNAVKHGNKCDESKTVDFTVRCEKNMLEFNIKDEGEGFNPIKELEDKSDVLTPHGMGISIITSLGYLLEYDKEKKYLVAIKKVVEKNNILEGNNYEPE